MTESTDSPTLELLKEVHAEIEYWHADMLEPEERNHPRGNGWARVYDKVNAAIARGTAENEVA